MSIGVRRLLAPGVAVAVAVGPAVAAPVARGPLSSAVLPPVHVENIRLAGIGQDIYYAVTPYVQYAVGGVSYLINFIPVIGGPIAAQININYFQGVQPIVEATVNYLAAVAQDPFNFLAATSAYGRQLFGIGDNWVDAELQFLGVAPLAPLLSAAAVGAPRRAVPAAAGPAAAVTVDAVSGATLDVPSVEAPDVDVPVVDAGARGGAMKTRKRVSEAGAARQRAGSTAQSNRSEPSGRHAPRSPRSSA